MQLSALASQYLKWFSARGASPKTIECYDLTYRQFVAYLMGQGQENDVRNFTPDHLEGFVTYLTEAGRKASSANVKLAALHSLGEYGKKSRDAKGRYILAENPLDRVVRPKRQKPAEKYLYAAELRQLLAVECPAPSRVALEMLVDTALRVSELTHANVEHLTLDGERVLLAVVVKGGRPRTVTLGAVVSGHLLESLRFREARPTDPLLVNEHGDRYTRTSLSELVLRLAKKAGITRILVRAHVLRHSVATMASATGADVPTIAAMLNHSDTHTAGRYIHRHEAVDGAREAVREALRDGLCLTPSKINQQFPAPRF
jgi:integrase/recombinase XerD